MKQTAIAESMRRPGAATEVSDGERRLSKLDHLLKLLRFSAVRERTGLSRSTIWRLERRGAFPKHVKISANVVAWLEEEVIEWIRSKMTHVSA